MFWFLISPPPVHSSFGLEHFRDPILFPGGHSHQDVILCSSSPTFSWSLGLFEFSRVSFLRSHSVCPFLNQKRGLKANRSMLGRGSKVDTLATPTRGLESRFPRSHVNTAETWQPTCLSSLSGGDKGFGELASETVSVSFQVD